MAAKTERVSRLLSSQPGNGGWDPRYRVFFQLLEQSRYYEAHDVLEDLWLQRRKEPDGNFYKALIQVAGAFVHATKGRWEPARKLLVLASGYFAQYPAMVAGLPPQELARWCRNTAQDWQDNPPVDLPPFPFLPEGPPPSPAPQQAQVSG
ncbi:DUF309 domain-containing protein [Candidatus Methylacidithermus pantelleriae]|nr:DUF309 domain-containing protein [Candidatus Methylacidithermus pantelleriae]